MLVPLWMTCPSKVLVSDSCLKAAGTGGNKRRDSLMQYLRYVNLLKSSLKWWLCIIATIIVYAPFNVCLAIKYLVHLLSTQLLMLRISRQVVQYPTESVGSGVMAFKHKGVDLLSYLQVTQTNAIFILYFDIILLWVNIHCKKWKLI